MITQASDASMTCRLVAVWPDGLVTECDYTQPENRIYWARKARHRGATIWEEWS